MLETVLNSLNTSHWIAAADSEDAFVGASDVEIGAQRMGFGVWDQPIHVLFGASKIAGPNSTPGIQLKATARVAGLLLSFASSRV